MRIRNGKQVNRIIRNGKEVQKLSVGTDIYHNSSLQLLTRNSDFSFWIDKATGTSFPTLAERTLPNGVKNGIHTKNVSDDYTIDLNIGGISSLTNVDQFTLTLPANFLVGVGIGKFIIDGIAEIPKANRDMISSIGKVANFETDTTLRYIIAKGTTLAQAQALLAGTVIRYQLATPISTINSPQVNPIVDLVGVVGKNLFDAFSGKFSVIGNFAKYTDNAVNFKIPISAPNNTAVTFKTTFTRDAGNEAKETSFRFKYSDGTYAPTTTFTHGAPKSYTAPAKIGVSVVELSGNENWALPAYLQIDVTQLELGTVATAYEPYGKANGLLQNFAFTGASGYVDVPIKGVGDEISYSNLVTNGDFANGTTGWTGVGATISATGDTLSNQGNGTDATPRSLQSSARPVTSGNRYYVKTKARVTTLNCQSLRVRLFHSVSAIGDLTLSSPMQNQWYPLSNIITSANAGLNLSIYASHTYADAATANGKVMEVQEVQSINLTDNPQVLLLESKLGRQLTAAECDYLFDFTATTNTIKAKVVTGIQGDGGNDVIVLPSNAPNPVGTQDFGFAFVFKTGATLGVFRSIMSRVGIDSTATQYDFIIGSDGKLYTLFENVSTPTSAVITTSTFYKVIVKRKNNRLYITINDVPLVDIAFSTSLTTKPNARLMARASNIEGTTHTAFSNSILLYDNYNNGDNIDAWESDQNKAIAKIYGL